MMQAHKLIVCISFLFLPIIAGDFDDINKLVEDEEYTQALNEMKDVSLTLITQKRLLARIARHWNDLSSRDQKKFECLLLDLLPADQTFVERIRERYLQLDEEEDFENGIAEAPEPPMVQQEPRPLPRKERPQPKVVTQKAEKAEAAPVRAAPKKVKDRPPEKVKKPVQKKDVKVQKKSVVKKPAQQKQPKLQPVAPSVHALEPAVRADPCIHEEL